MVLNLFVSADPFWCCESSRGLRDSFLSMNAFKLKQFFRLINNLPVLYSFGQLARAVLNKDNITPLWVIQQKCSTIFFLIY